MNATRISFRSLLLLLVSVLASSFVLTTSWGSSGEAVFAALDQEPAKTECAACHMAYPAGLLPARSWSRMMGELDRHFGEDASLSAEETASITRTLLAQSADNPNASPLMRRIASGIAAGTSPQRFTETAFFGYVHDEVPAGVWKRKGVASKANCVACHTKAEQGRFIEREIRIPKQ